MSEFIPPLFWEQRGQEPISSAGGSVIPFSLALKCGKMVFPGAHRACQGISNPEVRSVQLKWPLLCFCKCLGSDPPLNVGSQPWAGLVSPGSCRAAEVAPELLRPCLARTPLLVCLHLEWNFLFENNFAPRGRLI